MTKKSLKPSKPTTMTPKKAPVRSKAAAARKRVVEEVYGHVPIR